MVSKKVVENEPNAKLETFVHYTPSFVIALAIKEILEENELEG